MTTLIKGAQLILTGGRKLTEATDIFISGDKISAIGVFHESAADRVIDAKGLVVAPGFIDVNTDSDHYLSLFTNPSQDDFLRQGVTTTIAGQCGASLAPLLYGSLESIQKWIDPVGVNVDWHTMQEFLDLLAKRPLGVNFATLVGHSTIRQALLGDDLRSLTESELRVFAETLKQALAEGGFGLSTGLAYMHSQGTPASEIEFLAKIVADCKGVYATHLRKSGPELVDSIQETLAVQKKTGVKTLISHLLPLRGAEAEYEQALSTIEAMPLDQTLYFDLYPFSTSILPLYAFLPAWAKSGGLEKMRSNLADDWRRKKILNDLPDFNPDDLTVSRASQAAGFMGKTLTELGSIYSFDNPKETLLQLMSTTGLKASVFYRNINPNLIDRALKSPRSIVASNSASFNLEGGELMLKPERATATFPHFLTRVIEKNIMPIAEAVKKITLIPARLFQLEKRGEIKEGYFADLAGLRGGTIEFTMVNGEVSFKDGEVSPTRKGQILRHTSRA